MAANTSSRNRIKAIIQRFLKFDRRDIEIALTGLIKRGIFLEAATIEDYIPDPDDAIFYEVVLFDSLIIPHPEPFMVVWIKSEVP